QVHVEPSLDRDQCHQQGCALQLSVNVQRNPFPHPAKLHCRARVSFLERKIKEAPERSLLLTYLSNQDNCVITKLTSSAQPETPLCRSASVRRLQPLSRVDTFRSWGECQSLRKNSECLLKRRVYPKPIPGSSCCQR